MHADTLAAPDFERVGDTLERALSYLCQCWRSAAFETALRTQLAHVRPHAAQHAELRDALDAVDAAIADPITQDSEPALLAGEDALAAAGLGRRWLFHGTRSDLLPAIARTGLVPAAPGPGQRRHPDLPCYQHGKVFVTGCVFTAYDYACAACQAAPNDRPTPAPALLRTPSGQTRDASPDPEGLSGLDLFLTRAIPGHDLHLADTPVATDWLRLPHPGS